jgi:hypothetical protein
LRLEAVTLEEVRLDAVTLEEKSRPKAAECLRTSKHECPRFLSEERFLKCVLRWGCRVSGLVRPPPTLLERR